MPQVFSIGSQNTWSGCCALEHSPDLVLDYLCDQATQLSIFALQEVHKSYRAVSQRFVTMRSSGHRPGPIDVELGNHLQQRLKKSHRVYFHSHFAGAYHDYERAPDQTKIAYGNMLLVQRQVKILKQTTGHLIYGNLNLNTETGISGRPAARAMQIVTVMHNNVAITIGNVHGLHSRKGKGDLPARHAQSANIGHAVRLHQVAMNPKPPVILIGDFNYVSSQEALVSLLKRREAFGEDEGFNLNAIYNVTDTRTQWYPETKLHREANFALVSQRLVSQVTNLRAIRQLVPADHARLEVIF